MKYTFKLKSLKLQKREIWLVHFQIIAYWKATLDVRRRQEVTRWEPLHHYSRGNLIDWRIDFSRKALSSLLGKKKKRRRKTLFQAFADLRHSSNWCLRTTSNVWGSWKFLYLNFPVIFFFFCFFSPFYPGMIAPHCHLGMVIRCYFIL